MALQSPQEGHQWKHKAFAFIIKHAGEGRFTLLTHQIDGDDRLFLPGGRLDSGETFVQAMYREVWEESGIVKDDLIMVRSLGTVRYFNHETGHNVEQESFLLALPPDWRETWDYVVQGEGNDAGEVFRYQFINAQETQRIFEGHAAFCTPEDIPELFNESNNFVTIVDYDASWKSRFTEAKSALEQIIGEQVETIEHIGSTSIEGLAAKPVIDIAIGVQSLSDADANVVPVLNAVDGYEYVPEFEDTMPERRYFRHYNDDGQVDIHIHLWQIDNSEYQRHILFRDYLGKHIEERDAYAKLKRTLAKLLPKGAYTDAKTDFIRAIEEKARAERS